MFSSAKSNGVHGASLATLSKSLRFRSSASAYLNRTPSVSGSSTTWTYSAWIKRGIIGSGTTNIIIADNGTPASNDTIIGFNNDNIDFFQIAGNTTIGRKVTNAVFRDTSAWYHIVVVYDTTNATASNRIRIYVNGNQITSFGTSTDPAQNSTSFFNTATIPMRLSYSNGSGYTYFDGYMAEINFIDGQALTPSSFGATNATTGQWSPTTYSGSYGTNGFHLTFANTTSTTTLGYDTSGNSNNWTTNNISLTAGATYDSMNDVPVAYSATAANYAVLNPSGTTGATPITLSNGNLSFTWATASNKSAYSTIGMSSGKWYCEVIYTTVGSSPVVGISSVSGADPSTFCGFGATQYSYESAYKHNGNSNSGAYGASFTNNDVIGIAFDADAGSITFYKNGASQGVAYSSIPAGTYVFGVSAYNSTGSINFGQQPWQYAPPSGYNALNTYNLPTPTILQGNKYMDATLYTGNGVSGTSLSLSFQADYFWFKDRSAARDHRNIDTVRGLSSTLSCDQAIAEYTGFPTILTQTGNTITLGTTDNQNISGENYVLWYWKAGGTAVSNTSGTITSSVSASTTAGFSIVTFNAGTGSSAQTVGHGLGVAPSLIFFKDRTNAYPFYVYHSSGTTQNQYLNLTTTAAVGNQSGFWGSSLPTSSVFGFTCNNTVAGSANVVAYCFAPIAGFSAFGSYTGNGSATGPFIYTGFQPKFIMTKRTNTTGDWFIWDSARNTYNSLTLALYPDLNNAEYNYGAIWNFTSNGFYPVSNSVIANNSGDTYIYMAFASNPFAYSNAF